MKKVIIEGTVVRLVSFRNCFTGTEFSVNVFNTIADGKTFTIRTVVSCVARQPRIEGEPYPYWMPANAVPDEPLKTARMLALGDKVRVELKKGPTNEWEVVSIQQTADKGQDVGEFIQGIEEIIEEDKAKGIR